MRTIFACGHSENTVHTNSVITEGPLIQKPYGRVKLFQTIRAVLDEPSVNPFTSQIAA